MIAPSGMGGSGRVRGSHGWGEGVNNWIVDLGLVLKSLIEVNRGLRFEAKS